MSEPFPICVMQHGALGIGAPRLNSNLQRALDSLDIGLQHPAQAISQQKSSKISHFQKAHFSFQTNLTKEVENQNISGLHMHADVFKDISSEQSFQKTNMWEPHHT